MLLFSLIYYIDKYSLEYFLKNKLNQNNIDDMINIIYKIIQN